MFIKLIENDGERVVGLLVMNIMEITEILFIINNVIIKESKILSKH